MTRLLMLTVLMSLFSCDSNRVFEEFRSVEKWPENEKYSFEFTVADTQQPYNLIAHFKYDMAFRFQNFYFQVELTDERDSVLMDELHQVIFFEPKTGQPLGDGIGSSFDISHPIGTSFVFPKRGVYSLSYQQYMRVDDLSDILKTGFRLEKDL